MKEAELSSKVKAEIDLIQHMNIRQEIMNPKELVEDQDKEQEQLVEIQYLIEIENIFSSFGSSFSAVSW